MRSWVWALFALGLGIGLGLLYGWVIAPVRYVDVTPESLRPDYRAEYALAVAEAFLSDGDAALAAQRLERLGGPPGQTALDALIYARQAGWSATDAQRLESLARALGGVP